MLKNNMNPFKIMIITCWILLGIALICKLCGADWFIASSDNERFIKICNYIDSHKIIQNIMFATFNIFTTSIYFMAILKQNRPHLLWFIILIVYASLKVVFYNQVLYFILDFVITLILPLILDHKKWKGILLGVILNLGFQGISMLTKMNNYKMFDDNTLIYLLLNIDYVIMLILYWLYRIKPDYKKEEVESNG